MPSWAAELLRGSHTQYGIVRARYGGSWLQLEDSGGLAYRDRTLLPIADGTVNVDGTSNGARRTANVSFAPQAGLWDLLSTPGVELCPASILRAPSGQTVEIPQGVFPIDSVRISVGSSGRVQISSCPDRWSLVRAGRFFFPRVAPEGQLCRDAIAALLLEVLPAGTTVTDTSTSQARVPAGIWDRDRDKTITDLATAASVDVYFDRNGQPTIRDVPMLGNAPVWLVDASASGVLLAADRERSRQKTYNVVVISSDRADGSAQFDPVVVWDADPTSPTYAGPDPASNPSAAGPFGVRPYFWSSPLLGGATDAQNAGFTILQRVAGLAAQLTLTTVPNPGLEDGDVITVQLPAERPDIPRPVELHLVDSVSIPLAPSRGEDQTISTRSTRPDSVSET